MHSSIANKEILRILVEDKWVNNQFIEMFLVAYEIDVNVKWILNFRFKSTEF